MLAELEASAPEGAEAELELMRISLLRAERGGAAAEARLLELERSGLFDRKKDFQFHYQRACNSVAQGHAAEALEHLLHAGPGHDPWSRMMALTTRLICLDNLGFPLEEARAAVERELADCEIPELKAAATPAYHGVLARELFREGRLEELMKIDAGGAWSQVRYFQSLIGSLPCFDFSSLSPNPARLIQESLHHLTSDADFYLRSYRLQTLTGRAFLAPQSTPTSWGDRADRLYLWTWRWLLEPTAARAEALSMILGEFDQWDGHDVLTALDHELVRLALGWLALFEPRARTRWAALLRRASASEHARGRLFQLEDLWLCLAQARLARDGAEARRLENEIANHPLGASRLVAYSRIEGELATALAPSEDALVVDVDSGRLHPPEGATLRSLPLARLIDLLAREGRSSFSQTLAVCFEIEGFEPEVHDAKIQNLVNRARQLLGSPRSLRTKDRWIFFEKAQAHPLRFRVHRAAVPLATPAASKKKTDRLRNERSLSVLLRKAPALEGRWVSRLELEQALDLPKSTLNRYLQIWLKRRWLSRQGRGRAIRYQLSFFE